MHGFTAASEWETSQCLSYNILALGKFFEYSINLNFYGIVKYDTKLFQNIEYVKRESAQKARIALKTRFVTNWSVLFVKKAANLMNPSWNVFQVSFIIFYQQPSKIILIQWSLDLRNILGVTEIFLKIKILSYFKHKKTLEKAYLCKMKMSYRSIIAKCFWLYL